MATVPRQPEGTDQSFTIEFEQEENGKWLAEVPELPGVMAYGDTKRDAEVEVTALALRVIADRTVQVRKPPKSIHFQP
ncbi:MAG: type II toxin-antitoxin system HicB family antitoxin [Acidobacteriia bacterium]|nr:type II toxin-antitoxin system HicB family antitoxin [Terriglobia bacterium]